MQLSAVQPFTLLDYPDHVACIAFTPGCNFRCGYCHNPEFVLPDRIREIRSDFIPEECFFRFLESRRGMLEGVVVTGGEPTIMHDLLPFLREIRKMGYAVKLDTNGNSPEVLEQAIEEGVVQYIAMDIKTTLAGYRQLVGNRAKESALARSIALLKQSSIMVEFRSTLIKEVHSKEVLMGMVDLLAGATCLSLQTFRPGVTLHPLFQSFHPFDAKEMRDIADMFAGGIKRVVIRS